MDASLKFVLIVSAFFLVLFMGKKLIHKHKTRPPLKDGEEVKYKGRNVFERKMPGKTFDPDEEGYSEDAPFDGDKHN